MADIMTKEEEQACWVSMLWGAAARGEDPSVVWGSTQALTDLFVSACLDLHDLDLFLRSILQGDFTMARMCVSSARRTFIPEKWNLK